MKKLILILNILISINLSLYSQNEVLQVFDGKDYNPVPWSEIEELGFDETENLLHIFTETEDISIDADEKYFIPSGASIPLIEIITEEYLEEIPNKVDYKSGNFILKGFGVYEDIDTEVDIRGRGNSSWEFAKKPYRLKFDKKVSLCGLPKAKSYVLLANYSDCSLIQNSLAFEIGKMLELPFTNRGIPVDVKLNGIYKGSYLLTNKPGINSGSVDIDEDNSIMWELDVAYDEDYKFRSPLLDLPVMAVDPDLDDEKFEYWKNDFIEMEKAAIKGEASDLVDMDMLARYLLVYEVLKNDEIGWPKSVKLFKSKGEKYIFGPIWDFDTAMGKVWKSDAYTTDNIKEPVWKNRIISYLEEDSQFKEAFKNHWGNIKNRLPEIIDFIDSYSSTLYNSAIRNQMLWRELEDFPTSVNKMKEWITLRFNALDQLYGH